MIQNRKRLFFAVKEVFQFEEGSICISFSPFSCYIAGTNMVCWLGGSIIFVIQLEWRGAEGSGQVHLSAHTVWTRHD